MIETKFNKWEWVEELEVLTMEHVGFGKGVLILTLVNVRPLYFYEGLLLRRKPKRFDLGLSNNFIC